MKTYAKVCSPDVTDSTHYFHDFIDERHDLIIDGGREYSSYNDEYLSAIKNLINNYYEYEYGYAFEHSLREYVEYYAPKKANGKHYSNCELKAIKDAIVDSEEEDVIILVLSIVYGTAYKRYGLRGCCQGDYVDLYAPADTDRDTINYLESLYFNLGYEVEVHDDDTEVTCAEDINGYWLYIADYDVKRGLANELGCEEDELVVYTFDHYIHTPVYKII